MKQALEYLSQTPWLKPALKHDAMTTACKYQLAFAIAIHSSHKLSVCLIGWWSRDCTKPFVTHLPVHYGI